MRRLLARKTGDEPLAPPKRETAAELRAELGNILASREFKGSKRCQTFLRHVVEKTLSGQAGELKERTLAIELYGRPADADLEHDSAVRVCARHVRLRLERYYASAAASACKWRIELPPGSYAPAFIPMAAQPTGEAVGRRERGKRLWRILPLALAAAILALLLLWRFRPQPSADIDRFWGSAFAARRAEILLARLSAETEGRGQPAAFEAAAAAEIFHLFRSRNCAVQIHGLEEISSSAFSGASVVIGPPAQGAFMELLEDAPVRVVPGASPALQFLREERAEWLDVFRLNSLNSAVIYRIPGSQDRALHVVFAGLSPHATLAAARLLSHPESLSRLSREAPQEWDRRALAAVVLFPGGEYTRFRLLSALLWEPRRPAP